MFGLGVNRLGATNQKPFSPASLFNNGEAGVWYDPSSINTLYQDYQGVTPVTAVGQPVGLMLDKSEGLAQGAEEITNGDFATDSGWSKGPGWTISGGKATQSGGTGDLSQTITTVAGRSYLLSSEITDYVSGQLDVEAVSLTNRLWKDAAGYYSVIFVAASSSTIIRANPRNSVPFIGSIDNVSVKEIQGSHATQPTSTKRPIYARHPEGGIRNLLNYTEQFDNGAWAKISTGGAAVSVIPSSYVAPDGTYSATQVLGLDTSGSRLDQNTAFPTLANKTYTYSVWLRGSGVISITANSTTGVGGGTEIGVTLTSTWTRHDVTHTFTSSPTGNVRVHGVITRATGTAPEVHMWSPQLEVATEASNYQKVVTDIDVTESGVGEVYYLKFDGVDDGMFINNLTSASTPITALFGYKNEESSGNNYLLDIQIGRLILAASYATNPPVIALYDGTWRVDDNNAVVASTHVSTFTGKTGESKLRVDGTEEATGGFTQRPFNGTVGLFRRYDDAQDNFVNGNMYQTILRAAESTDEEIAKAETYVANKTGLKAQVDGIATLDLNFGNNTYTAKNSNGGVI